MKYILTVLFLILFCSLKGQNIIRSLHLIYENNLEKSEKIKLNYYTDSTFTMYMPAPYDFKVIGKKWFIQNAQNEYSIFYDENKLNEVLQCESKNGVKNDTFLLNYGDTIIRDNVKFHFLSINGINSPKHKLYFEFSPIIGFIRLGAFNSNSDLFLKKIETYNSDNQLIETEDLKSYLAKMK
jgi:hypothetical protein